MTTTTEHQTAASARTVLIAGMHCEIVQAVARVGDPDHVMQTERRLDLRRARTRIADAVTSSGMTWVEEPVALELPSAWRAWPGCDLAFAAAVLAAAGAVPARRLVGTVLLGGLAESGRIEPVRGVLPALMAARRAGVRRVIVAHASTPEELIVPDIEILRAANLADVVGWLRGDDTRLTAPESDDTGPQPRRPTLDGILGQPEARWAAEIAAAGGHHLVVMGQPEERATSIARYLHRLLPPLSEEQAIDVAVIHSLAGQRSVRSPLDRQAPLATAHCADCAAELLGDQSPGAASRAHHGVLMLGSVSVGSPAVLREVLQLREVVRSVGKTTTRYPADFQLVVTLPRCPYHDADGWSPWAPDRHLAGLSEPVLERIALRVVLRMDPVADDRTLEPEAVVRARVQRIRYRAAQRWSAHGTAWTNATVPASVLYSDAFRLSGSVTAELDRRLVDDTLTQAGSDDVVRVAWTLADRNGDAQPTLDAITTALALCEGQVPEVLARSIR